MSALESKRTLKNGQMRTNNGDTHRSMVSLGNAPIVSIVQYLHVALTLLDSLLKQWQPTGQTPSSEKGNNF